MKTLSLTLYFISFVPRWYDGKWSIRSVTERPTLIDSPNKQFAFLVTNSILRYGTFFLIWYAFSLRWALLALAGGWAISKIISQVYFNKESEKWIQLYKADRRAANPNIDERQLRKEAYNYASGIMFEHTKAKR
jgi:hypothetical protein